MRGCGFPRSPRRLGASGMRLRRETSGSISEWLRRWLTFRLAAGRTASLGICMRRGAMRSSAIPRRKLWLSAGPRNTRANSNQFENPGEFPSMTTATANPTLTGKMTGQEIVDLSKKHTLFEWSAQSKVDPIPVARAKGIYFWTPEGKRFIDFNSQLMSVNIGHGDERVIRAIAEQASALAYANPFMATEPRARLGAKLAEISPGDIDTFFFTNGGAEANENAIKIARFFTGRHKILARYRSYHGATAGAVSLTGDPRRWAAEPGIPGVVRVLDPYHGIERGWESSETSLAMIEEIIQLEGPQTIAAFFLEIVTGTNAFFVRREEKTQ